MIKNLNTSGTRESVPDTVKRRKRLTGRGEDRSVASFVITQPIGHARIISRVAASGGSVRGRSSSLHYRCPRYGSKSPRRTPINSGPRDNPRSSRKRRSRSLRLSHLHGPNYSPHLPRFFCNFCGIKTTDLPIFPSIHLETNERNLYDTRADPM